MVFSDTMLIANLVQPLYKYLRQCSIIWAVDLSRLPYSLQCIGFRLNNEFSVVTCPIIYSSEFSMPSLSILLWRFPFESLLHEWSIAWYYL